MLRLKRKSLALWQVALILGAWFSTPAAAATHNVAMAPVAAGTYPVACTNLAHDTNKLQLLGGALDDYWTGTNGHYVTDILLEPADTLKTSPLVPDQGLYARRRNSILAFVIFACYPTTETNSRPDYVLPDGQTIPRMQRAGQAQILSEQPCITIYPTPAGCGRWPLLAFSHGLGSSPVDGYSIDIMVRLASYGYIVAAPFHGDGRFVRLSIEDISDLSYLTRNFDEFVELQALRPLAVKSMIDLMLAHPDFSAKIDAERIGGFGASMGGETMALLLGASLTDTSNLLHLSSSPTVNDLRIKVAAGYVPYAGQKYLPAFGKNNDTAGNVRVPFLAISGSEDSTAPMYRMDEAMQKFRGTRYLVALSGVGHHYEAAYADDVFGWVVPFFDAYLNSTEAGRASRDRLTQQQNILGGIDDRLMIADEVPILTFVQGWNLLGNGLDAPIDVATTFADTSRFLSIWKWLPAQATWAFYAPSLAAQGGANLVDYVAAKGYRSLTTIAGGEGFWVNASQNGSVTLASGNPVSATTLGSSLGKGWNLVSVGETATPKQFYAALGSGVTSLWAWDAARNAWYFYAPSLDANGGLASYLASKAYLDFTAGNKTLGNGTGFWVNKP